MNEPAGGNDNAGTVLSKYLETELSAEQARRESLERRGLALVTVSGVLTTLLISLPSTLLRDHPITLSWSTRVAVIVALAAFVLTIGCGTLPRGCSGMRPTATAWPRPRSCRRGQLPTPTHSSGRHSGYTG